MKHWLQGKSQMRLDKVATLLLFSFFLSCQSNTKKIVPPHPHTEQVHTEKQHSESTPTPSKLTKRQKQTSESFHSDENQKTSPDSTKHKAPPTEAPLSTALPQLPDSFPCGEHQCYAFDSSQNILASVILHHRARIVAFGEAHFRSDMAGTSTVHRFTYELLPSIASGTDFLLVELLQPPAQACEQQKAKAQKEANKITTGQSSNNQNEYLALGHQAARLNIAVDILRASCTDMENIAAPNGGVVAMMETIGRLSKKALTERYGKTRKGRPLVLAYGGALHNDASPRPARENWSYGPSLIQLTQGSYLEIDLIVPELIANTDSWRSFVWYEAYNNLKHQTGFILMKWGERSYSLFFPPQAIENRTSTTSQLN